MALMHTEDELAAVLAHEVEHVDHYHCIDRYVQARAAGQIPVVGALAQLPVALFEAGYAKTQELEADADGTRLAARAGYAPLAIVALLQAMEERRGGGAHLANRPASPVHEVLSVPGDVLEGYFRSHPPEAERIARITDVVTSDRLVRAQALRPLSLPPRTPAPGAPSGPDGP
jgi:Zn-dependent protease with chaperone function